VVRVPWLEPGILMKSLDAGAYGVICPMINTKEDAQKLVAYTHYAPRGTRSFGPVRALLYGGADYPKHANDTIVTFAMIETAAALDNLDDILSVEGLDAIYIGPSDLSLALGCNPTFDDLDPKAAAAVDHILARAKAHGVVAGIHNGTPESAQKRIAKGFQFVTVSSDARLMAADAQAELSMARQELNAAEAAARDLNALPDVPAPAADTIAKGTSTAEGALSQGSLRHSEKMGEIREANQVRKGIAGYRQGLPQGERVPLTGYTQSSRLIVPNELADAPVKSALQIEAENNLKAAQEKHAAAVKRAADAKVQQEAAMKPSRPEASLSSDVTKASSTTAGKKAALDELTKARSFLSKIPGFNTLMGGLSGAELVHAYRQLQEGNTLEGVMAGLSGAGGLIAMAPHPVAKVIGTAMSVPPLAYQGYQAFKGDNAGVPTNVNPMGD
jgi:4-hydroxy-2-oxoheptanedioate aldolase